MEKTLKDAELIKQFKKLDKLPEDEKNTILKVINALIRDLMQGRLMCYMQKTEQSGAPLTKN